MSAHDELEDWLRNDVQVNSGDVETISAAFYDMGIRSPMEVTDDDWLALRECTGLNYFD